MHKIKIPPITDIRIMVIIPIMITFFLFTVYLSLFNINIDKGTVTAYIIKQHHELMLPVAPNTDPNNAHGVAKMPIIINIKISL